MWQLNSGPGLRLNLLWIIQFSVIDIFLVAGIETVKEALKCALSSFSDGSQNSLKKKQEFNLHMKF